MKYIYAVWIFIGLSDSAFDAVCYVYYYENMKTSDIEIDWYVENSSPDTEFKFEWDGTKIIFGPHPLGHSNTIYKVDPNLYNGEMIEAQAGSYTPWNIFYFDKGE